MTKRRLSKLQRNRIDQKQQARVKRADQKDIAEELIHSQQLGPEQKGLLIRCFRVEADVESDDKRIIRCRLRQNMTALVAGDQVIWRAIDETHGVVVAVCPRHSVLGKFDKQGVMKPVAANVDQLIVVVAPQPQVITTLLDSYLVAAEMLKLPVLIIVNKIDLLEKEAKKTLQTQLSEYEQLGYPILYISVYQGNGLDAFLQALAGKISVLVGQSGVGKSSLISALLPGIDIRIQQLSDDLRHGQHTTTNSQLYHLANEGFLIDSPGVRAFSLWHMAAAQIARGFIEFRPYLAQCKFSDCSHDHEPGCALHQAVEKGAISAERLANYHKIVQMYAQ